MNGEEQFVVEVQAMVRLLDGGYCVSEYLSHMNGG